jgi:putative FmdB family regulatory protein
MPSYDYYCEECDERYEKQMTIKEFEVEAHCCPLCGAKGKKVMYAPPVHTRLSLMHPRHMRGQKGERKTQKGNVMG